MIKQRIEIPIERKSISSLIEFLTNKLEEQEFIIDELRNKISHFKADIYGLKYDLEKAKEIKNDDPPSPPEPEIIE